jgi:hypothetical protein
MPPQPAAGVLDRIASWAASQGKTGTPSRLAARLDGPQVAAELQSIFRETPEFGRSLMRRIVPFLDEGEIGPWQLIGGGGEAIILYDAATQRVIKLFAPPCHAAFGWMLDRHAESGEWELRAGQVAEALRRFALFEAHFDSGLEVEEIGQAGDYLLLSQPFIVGEHPDEPSLHAWMSQQGWQCWVPPTQHATIHHLTWRREQVIVTDVRPENALRSLDGEIRPIDFIIIKEA